MAIKRKPDIPLRAFSPVRRRSSRAELRLAEADRVALAEVRLKANLEPVPARSSSTELDLLAALDVWRAQGTRLDRATMVRLDPDLVRKIEAHFDSFGTAVITVVRGARAASRASGAERVSRGGTEV